MGLQWDEEHFWDAEEWQLIFRSYYISPESYEGIQEMIGVPQPTPPEEPPDNKEALKVLQWRRIYLERAGYDPEAAKLLGESSVDLHKAAYLIEKGCDPTTALLILL